MNERGIYGNVSSTRLTTWLIFLLLSSFLPIKLSAQDSLETAHIVDSLFIRASSGEVKYRDLVEPSKEALIEMGERAIPQMLTKLNTRDARERHTIVDIFKGIGEIAVKPLVDCLDSSNDYTRRLAIRCLGDIESPLAVEPLMMIAGHDDFRTRTGVMTALGKIGDQKAARTVVEGLSDSNEMTATAAAVACGKIKQGIDPEALILALNHRYYGVRYSAAGSLAEIGDEAVKPLIKYLKSGKTDLSTGYAIEALGKTGSKKALTVLKSMMVSDNWDIRAFTAEALGNIKTKKSKKILSKALKGETHPLVLSNIRVSLKKLQKE